MTTPGLEIREPSAAGVFYPSEPEELQAAVRELLDDTKADPAGDTAIALISPHAGYPFSGSTAAYGFNLVSRQSTDVAVIVSPSHREYFDGISVFDGDAYRTPLGIMPVHKDLRSELLAGGPAIEASGRGHGEEHSIEVQLPFLQTIFGNIDILPIVIGDQRREYCFRLGEQLGSILRGRNALLIASTDLSHYYTSEVAQELDQIIIDDVAAFDYELLMDDLENGRSEACGGGPTVAVLIAAKKLGAGRVRILSQCNSGDIAGDRRRVVGYVSAAALL